MQSFKTLFFLNNTLITFTGTHTSPGETHMQDLYAVFQNNLF